MDELTQPARIEPAGIYHDGQARLLLGLTDATMRSARRSGQLRFARKGTRTIYLGQWLIDWLECTSTQGGGQ